MNLKTLNIFRIILGVICIAIGIDKFFNFLSICSLMDQITNDMAIAGGIIEIVLGLLILFRIQLIPTLYVTALLMAAGVIAHLVNDTYDISGAFLLMCYALGLVCFYRKEDNLE